MITENPNFLSGFLRMTASRLEEFGKQYTPHLGTRVLETVRRFYLNELRREPTPSELFFLDRFAYVSSEKPDAFLFFEMLTNDREIAKTLADLMANRAALEPDHSIPCSFEELLDIADRVLGAEEEDFLLSCRSRPMLDLASRHTASIPLGNSLAIAEKPKKKRTALAEGDRIYAVFKDGSECADFESALSALSQAPALLSHAKAILPIEKGGILSRLLTLEHGLCIELDRLFGSEAEYEALTKEEPGLLVVIDSKLAADVLMEALEKGLRPRTVGRLLNEKGGILLSKEGCPPLCYPIAFLRSLTEARAYRTELCDRENSDCRIHSREVLRQNGYSTWLTEGHDGNPYYTALYAVTAAVSSAIAGGARQKDILLAERIRLPLADIAPQKLGDALARLLGVYRALTELGLPSACHALQTNTMDAALEVYAVIPSEKNTIRETFCADHSLIFLLEPRMNGEIPDFEDLSKMYDYIDSLRRDGILLSARAVCGDVMPVLEEMSRGGLIEYLRREPRSAAPGSILVEAGVNIQGTLLAKTCVPESPAETAEPEVQIEE